MLDRLESGASARPAVVLCRALWLVNALAGGIVLLLCLATVLAHQLIAPRFPVPARGVVLVTGASSGIGEDSVRAIAADTSLQVFAGVRKQADAKRLTATYPGIQTLYLDVTSSHSIAAAVRQITNVSLSHGLPFVALVNNAGVQSDLPIELQSSAADHFTFDVNVFGVLDTTRAFLPLLRQAGSGARIVNVGSLSGRVAPAGSATYSASKFAVEGLTDSLRREVEPFGISVSLLEPGYVQSKMGEKLHTADAVASHYGVSEAEYSLYRHVFEAFFAMDRRNALAQNSQPPATTTSVDIVHALTSPRPQTRYLSAAADGMPAWFIALAARLLPDRIMDALM